MTLHDVGRALRERWFAVVVSILVALLAGGALFLARPASYTATLTVYAAPSADPAATTPDAAYQGSLLAKERIPSYVQLITSPQVVSQVVARGQLPTDVDDLSGRVTATNTEESVLIDVAVSAPSSAEAVATANAFADVLPAAVAQIEQNGVPGAQPAVTLGVIRPVPVPQRPSTPGLGATLLVALLAGVVVGVAVALVRDALDRSVRTTEDLAEALSGGGLPAPAPPVLASLPAPDRRGTEPGEPGSRDAEAYRQLRTALHAGRHAAPGVLAVTSPGEGDGRTTVTCSLAAAAAAAGLAVVVVDADLRRPMVATMFGVGSRTGLTDVLSGRLEAEAAVRTTRTGVDVLPTGSLPSNPSELLAAGGLADVLGALHAGYDLVLVDTPPTLPVTDAAVVAEAAGGVVLLARTRRTRPADLTRACRILDAAGGSVVGAVLVGATDGATLAVEPGDRSAIVPRPRPRSADATRTSGRPEGRAPGTEAATETVRPAARAMPEPRAAEPVTAAPRAASSRTAEPRAAEPRAAEPRDVEPRRRREEGRNPEARPRGTAATVPPPPASAPPAPSAGRTPATSGARASRHGLPADTTAQAPRPTPRTPTPHQRPAATSDAPAGARSDGSALSFAGSYGSRPEENGQGRNGQGRNGHAPNDHGPNGYVQNGHVQNGHVQNGHVQNGHVQNGHSPVGGSGRNGQGDAGFGRGADGAPAQAGGSARHVRRDADAAPRGR